MPLLLNILNFLSESDDKNKKSNREIEMDYYGLDDYQKDLVRKRKYEPYNFEEDDDLDEDDYYYEDDK